MPFWGADYVVIQYIEWITCLGEKGQENLLSDFQNINLLGMVRKTDYAITAGLPAYYEVFESAGKIQMPPIGGILRGATCGSLSLV